MSFLLPSPILLHALEGVPTLAAFVVADGDMAGVHDGAVGGTAFRATNGSPENTIRIYTTTWGPPGRRVRQVEVGQIVEEVVHEFVARFSSFALRSQSLQIQGNTVQQVILGRPGPGQGSRRRL